MFAPGPGPRVFGLAPGIDFAAELVAGLRARLAGQPPEAMARVELFVNTARMSRRIVRLCAEDGPGFLPRIRLLSDPAPAELAADLPAPVSGLRRRLELTALVSRLLDAEPDLAPRAALFDLADSLASLMEEMQIEDVAPERIAGLDVSDQSGHWQRALRFLDIVQRYFAADGAPDPAAAQRLAVARRIALWRAAPPQHPVIVAGSTGSRGTAARLMAAVAHLPQGALVLPGWDRDLPRHVWDRLIDADPRADLGQPGEDHPQYRFARLLAELPASPADVAPWSAAEPPAPDRNRLISLALRPAPITDQWLAEGPALPDLEPATAGVTLLEAATRREEALAIALRLRQAAEDGTEAALITPDRQLTRQVTAALDRWGIVPDDSAGRPAHLSAPGRLLRHVAGLAARPLTAEALLTLLKHPLTHSGAKGRHGLWTQQLELHIRRAGIPYPDADALEGFRARAPEAGPWLDWVIARFCGAEAEGARPLADWLRDHIALAEAIAAGSESADPRELWAREAGRAVRAVVDELAREAGHGTALSARDYESLFQAVLGRAEVRNPDAVHPHIRIWGTLEARVMGADLLILGSLNDGAWPELPGADPWLNRRMRAEAGLTLPERRIGLSAHDFQQAAAAREVWFSRALKSDDAETVPSRWLNRITNLLAGLPGRGGDAALAAMRARGARWRDHARALDAAPAMPPAPRPAPAPPVEHRPRKLPVTAIRTLVRDPYAIYAARILNLRPLPPLQREPDALLRGIVVHELFETFVRDSLSDPGLLDPAALLDRAGAAFAQIPFPLVRQLWTARLGRIAPAFVAEERARQSRARPAHFEAEGEVEMADPGFTLTARADRIDIDDRGGAWLFDYKTGAPPTADQQRHFDKQLLLTAAMVMRGGFAGLDPRHVAGAAYIGLGSKAGEVPAPLEEMPPDAVWAELAELIRRYLDPDKGYTARRAMAEDRLPSDYDHLSRLGEWDVTDLPRTERMG
ncbi:double-strand break repair protein AddB [Roseivivax sp. CAU 1761]